MSQKSKELLEDCIAYFRERPVYRRLFGRFREKYASLGRFGGSVTLSGLTREDKAQLGGFLQKDYSGNKTVTVSAALLEKALAGSRFAALSWEEILCAYFGEPLTVKREERMRLEQERDAFFRRVMEEYAERSGTAVRSEAAGCPRAGDDGIRSASVSGSSGRPSRALVWLEAALRERRDGYQFLMQHYREDPAVLGGVLANVLAAIDRLPYLTGRRVLLPVFAAEVTGDPHYFDAGMPGERLLGVFLRSTFGSMPDGERSAAEQRTRLFYEAGILRDDLSNDTLVYGIRAVCLDGRVHEGIEGFFLRREPVRLTLRTFGNLQSASGTSRIYIVENPAVFSTLIQEYPDLTVICGNGQPRIATLVLMDFLSRESTLYYAGDFDAEGLAIAQRLKDRYGERLVLWGYRADWYLRHLSEVRLEDPRLKKLEQVRAPELLEVRNALLVQKRAAYQEQMLPELLESLHTGMGLSQREFAQLSN